LKRNILKQDLWEVQCYSGRFTNQLGGIKFYIQDS